MFKFVSVSISQIILQLTSLCHIPVSLFQSMVLSLPFCFTETLWVIFDSSLSFMSHSQCTRKAGWSCLRLSQTLTSIYLLLQFQSSVSPVRLCSSLLPPCCHSWPQVISYEVNMCPSKFSNENPNPLGDGVRRWGFGEVTSS